MSSKLPVPTFYRRDWKSCLPLNDSDKISPNSSTSEDTKKPKDKYAHVSSKVKTHWSFEERQRSGIKDFFERKSGSSSANTSVNTSATLSSNTSPVMIKHDRRRSLPMPSDPIAVAIAQIKRNTRFYTFSDSAPTSTSMSSINEAQEN